MARVNLEVDHQKKKLCGRQIKILIVFLSKIFRYIPWNFHETFHGQYEFDKQRDLVRFINLAQKQELLVILRPGPYICSEWDYGGFPYWIFTQCGDKIRTSDEKYIGLVDKWFGVLFSRLTPLLYTNGGPIISLQVSIVE